MTESTKFLLKLQYLDIIMVTVLCCLCCVCYNVKIMRKYPKKIVYNSANLNILFPWAMQTVALYTK